jgi:hypothetical protein
MDTGKTVDGVISGFNDWRGAVMANLRKIILEADPQMTEELKWHDAPSFSDNGLVCLLAAFKDKVKMTFNMGAALPDPAGLFNSELEGKQWRAIDFFKDSRVDEKALKALVQAAVALNKTKAKPTKKKTTD